MDKSLAVRQIYAVADWRIRNQLRNSEFMQEELRSALDYYFSEEKVSQYYLQEYSNGFYLGEIWNNERQGYGAYLWYNESPPNSVYIGYWEHGNKNGEGFYLMTSGMCYYGEFVNDKFQGEHSHVVGSSGIEFEAEFYNDDIIKVLYSNGGFTYNGKSYGGGSSSGSSSGGSSSSSGSSCLGFIIIIAIVWGCFKFCGSCSCSSDNHDRTEISETTTTYVCTARKSLKVRTSPSTSASQIGSIMSGEEVEVYSISNGFAKIRYNGDIGYASTKYLKHK